LGLAEWAVTRFVVRDSPLHPPSIGIFLHKTKNLKPPFTLARNLDFVMFMRGHVKGRFNLNVGGFKFHFKTYIMLLIDDGTTLEGVSLEENISNDDSITSFLKLVKRTQN
jgi:hypothetical protein